MTRLRLERQLERQRGTSAPDTESTAHERRMLRGDKTFRPWATDQLCGCDRPLFIADSLRCLKCGHPGNRSWFSACPRCGGNDGLLRAEKDVLPWFCCRRHRLRWSTVPPEWRDADLLKRHAGLLERYAAVPCRQLVAQVIARHTTGGTFRSRYRATLAATKTRVARDEELESIALAHNGADPAELVSS